MSEPASDRRLVRFDVVERIAHWSLAALFIILMLTAVPLYVGSVAQLVGRRALLAEIHSWCGVALPVPLIVSLLGPWGRRLRRDVRRLNLWTSDERRWLRSLGRYPVVEPGKFNAGQKLNAAFTAGVIVAMLVTGSVMHWYKPFPVDWRTGATFVHDVIAFAVFAVVIGHIGFALTHRDALRSMFGGRVSRRWARTHAPAWLKELEVGEEEPARRVPVRGS
ncbi:MAG: formate dehydrogenase [Actinobacteria bacterium]|nr:MAG: formate dehydrogenase [Actinomycetota bacterium]